MRGVTLLVLALCAVAMAAEWDIIAQASTKTNPETIVAMRPHPPIVVEAVVPPVEKAFNKSKTTPGAKCSKQTDCNTCIGYHFCLWTKESKCIRAGTAKARKLQYQGKALKACYVKDTFNRTTVEVVRHRLTRAKIARPAVLEPSLDLHGVPVRVPANQQRKFVFPVNAIKEGLNLPPPAKNRDMFKVRIKND